MIIHGSQYRIPPDVGVAYPLWDTDDLVAVGAVWLIGYSGPGQENQSSVWVANASGDRLIGISQGEIREWRASDYGLTSLNDLYVISQSANDGLGVIWARSGQGLVNNVGARVENAIVRLLSMYQETIGLDCQICRGLTDVEREKDYIACHVSAGDQTDDFGQWILKVEVMIMTEGFDPENNAAVNKLDAHERREAIVIDALDQRNTPDVLTMLEHNLYVQRGSLTNASFLRNVSDTRYQTVYNFNVCAVGADL